MAVTDLTATTNEEQNRCIARIIPILRRYGAIDLTRQEIVVQVAFAHPDAEGAATDATGKADVKPMHIEEIEYAGEGAFALRVTEAADGPEAARLTKKAAATLRAQTERQIVLHRDGAAQFPRIASEALDRICEAVEAFDRS